MFSGIVESQGVIRQSALSADQFGLKLSIATPAGWDDLRVGDSVAVNGICLTLENPEASEVMQFSLGAETLKVLGPKGLAMFAANKSVNLERSLRFGDRIHGHLVSGHVDEVVDILESRFLGESLQLKVALSFCWQQRGLVFTSPSSFPSPWCSWGEPPKEWQQVTTKKFS